MEPKEFFDSAYQRIEQQHNTVDDIATNLTRFNPIRVKAGMGQVINGQHQMKNFTIESGVSGNFKGLVEHISYIYSKGGLYVACADPSSKIIPQVSFTEGFIKEATGMLYLTTLILSESAIPSLEKQDGSHYLKSAAEQAKLNLEQAIQLSPETNLAKSLIGGVDKLIGKYSQLRC